MKRKNSEIFIVVFGGLRSVPEAHLVVGGRWSSSWRSCPVFFRVSAYRDPGRKGESRSSCFSYFYEVRLSRLILLQQR